MAENAAPPPPPPAIVSAGESDHITDDDDDDEPLKYGDPTVHADHLYGANLDQEDEAWVYQNLRSGVAQNVSVVRNDALEQAKLLKPRTSDAVLSCPCCFTIVCMDCQRHEKYVDQFRAMFVMNIGVDWDSKLVYKNKGLVDARGDTTVVVDEEVYNSVHCIQCQTQVAALDMKEELYHFFGCLASS